MDGLVENYKTFTTVAQTVVPFIFDQCSKRHASKIKLHTGKLDVGNTFKKW